VCEKYVLNPSIERRSNLHRRSRRRQKRCPEELEVRRIEDGKVAKIV
jgi:hypothetical protein